MFHNVLYRILLDEKRSTLNAIGIVPILNFGMCHDWIYNLMWLSEPLHNHTIIWMCPVSVGLSVPQDIA